ncbi:Ankyrin-3-like protein 4 [Colletotrichum chlorophyti]|uniref:Ankyrin-3-like protein 4 n=1 Tax=Colletotrichum chlorophyti TaxID=708187 RepID=A0A1Q8S245_9PEZI|nr:Ankyrin-3-like protein 4 [Colletotrichum chlorophyti]
MRKLLAHTSKAEMRQPRVATNKVKTRKLRATKPNDTRAIVDVLDKLSFWSVGRESLSEPWWAEKPWSYLALVYDQHAVALGDIADPIGYLRALDIEDISSSIATDQSPSGFIDELRQKSTQWLSRVYPGAKPGIIPSRCQRRSVSSYYLAMSNLMGLGRRRDQNLGVAWMAVAAVQGNTSAIVLCHQMIIGCGFEKFFPKRLFLCLDALQGYRPAMDLLARRWPDGWKMVRRAYREREPLEIMEDPYRGLTFKMMTVFKLYENATVSPEHGFPNLRKAVLTGTIVDMSEILNGMIAQTFIPKDASKTTPTLLHLLTFSAIPDNEAAKLASLAHKAGARLNKQTWFRSSHFIFDDDCKGTPLYVSIRRGRTCLALEIISIHDNLDLPILGFSDALKAAFIYSHHKISRRLLHLSREKPWLCRDGPAQWECTTEFLSNMLWGTIRMDKVAGLIEVERLATHGESSQLAKMETQQLLLELGADPAGSAVESCLSSDDIDTFRLFIQHLQGQRPDNTRTQLFGQESVVFGGLCISSGAIRCFNHLLSKHLITVGGSSDGEKLMRHAIDKLPHSTSFISSLLENGATFMDTHENRLSALYRILLGQHTMVADMLSRRCSEQELAMLLCRDPASGRSLFTDLLTSDPSSSGTIPFESLKWLASRGGAHYHGLWHKNGAVPVWHGILDRPRDTTRTLQLAQAKAISFLLSLEGFRDKMTTEPCAPCQEPVLHHAAMNGHTEIVRVLLRHGFDANVVCPETESTRGPGENTALQCVWARLRIGYVPEEIQAGGRLEVMKWNESLVETVDLLVAAGATSLLLYWDRFNVISQASVPREGLFGSAYLYSGGRPVVGSWPESLPSTAPSARAERMIVEDSDSDSTESLQDHERNLPLLFWAQRQSSQRALRVPFLPGEDDQPAISQLSIRGTEALVKLPRWIQSGYSEGTTTRLHFAALANDIETLRSLLDNVDRVDIEDEAGFTPLHLAVAESHEEAIVVLYEHGAALDKLSTFTGGSAIHVAVEVAKLSTVELLLKLGADANASFCLHGTTHTRTALTHCIEARDKPGVIHALVRGGAQLDSYEEPDQAPIALAVIKGRAKTLKLILDLSKRPWRGTRDSNLVMLASRHSKYRVMKVLLDFAARHPNSPHSATLAINPVMNESREAPLLIAAESGDRAIGTLLLERGADVHAVGPGGWTPLFWAVWVGSPGLVRALLQKGAHVHAVNEAGFQPLDYALATKMKRRRRMNKIAALLLEHGARLNTANILQNLPRALSWSALSGNLEDMKMILDGGADVNGPSDESGWTALMSAAEKGHTDAATLLLDRGADPNAATLANGNTALLMAAKNGHLEVIELLLQRGANIDALSKRGSTALGRAMAYRHQNVVNLLITRNADLASRDRNGRNAWFWAAWCGFSDTAKLLIERGFNADVVDDNGRTAFFHAAQQGHADFVGFLLDFGDAFNKESNNLSTIMLETMNRVVHDYPTKGKEIPRLRQNLRATLDVFMSRGADVTVLAGFDTSKLFSEGGGSS